MDDNKIIIMELGARRTRKRAVSALEAGGRPSEAARRASEVGGRASEEVGTP